MLYIIYAQKLKEPEVNTVDLFLVNLTCWVLGIIRARSSL